MVSISQDIDTHLLAAMYTEGDLVVYNLEAGQPIAIHERANTMMLASSHDGRTLAGVDSQGNLTLSEFDTLRALYRIQFDSRMIPKAMVFSADSQRFMEITRDRRRVWGATVLLRADSGEDENSDTVSVSSGPQEVDYQPITGPNITAITCCQCLNVVFAELEDGSVYAYDISSEPERHLLYVQTRDCSIRLLHVDEPGYLLVSGDVYGRVMVHKVGRTKILRQNRTVWNIEGQPLFDRGSLGSLKQILVTGQRARLLVCTDERDTLWALPQQGSAKAHQITQVRGTKAPRWALHLTDSEVIIRAEPTTFDIYRWADLTLVKSTRVSFTGSFDRILSTLTQYLATISASLNEHTKIPSSSTPKRTPCGQIWDLRDLERDDGLAPINQLHHAPSHTELLFGVFEARLVFLTRDFWVASVDLAPDAPKEDSVVRHFLVPPRKTLSCTTEKDVAVAVAWCESDPARVAASLIPLTSAAGLTA